MEKENINNKDFTKEKIILFAIGVLVGAVISTGAFLAYINIAGIGGSSQSSQMPGGGTPPEMPGGENGQSSGSGPSNQNNQNGTPPEKPSGNSTSDSSNSSSSSNNN